MLQTNPWVSYGVFALASFALYSAVRTRVPSRAKEEDEERPNVDTIQALQKTVLQAAKQSMKAGQDSENVIWQLKAVTCANAYFSVLESTLGNVPAGDVQNVKTLHAACKKWEEEIIRKLHAAVDNDDETSTEDDDEEASDETGGAQDGEEVQDGSPQDDGPQDDGASEKEDEQDTVE